MKKHLFWIRNLEAGEDLENFLVSAVASILIIRLYLKLTDYPQIGGATLHIAHMLWGGLLMLAALIILIAFLNRSAQRWAAVIGGIGFGTFIDEVGKFVTRENDYFYQPAVALMYITFILIVLGVRAIHHKRIYSKEEYLMNTLRVIEEVALHDLDENEKNRALSYLENTDPEDPLADALRRILTGALLVPTPRPGIPARIKHVFRDLYLKTTRFPGFTVALVVFFLVQLVLKMGHVIALVFFKGLGVDQIFDIGIFSRLAERFDNLTFVEWAEFASSLLSAVFVFLGVIRITRSRLAAFKLFERSVWISIFLTQVFMFYQEQFIALVGLTLNLLILAALRYMIHTEASRTA
ncbi:MAG TPA: hypothetical protein ENN17_08085 [bacterium]|nr:hypothetical protein [bacterium]